MQKSPFKKQTKSPFKSQLMIAAIVFALLALLFGIWSRYNTTDHPKEVLLKSGTAFPIPREIKPFELKNASGGEFTNAQLKGNWSMLFFGFTNCAMLCPTTLTTLNHVYGILETDKVKQLPQIVFVSIDPERDSLPRIKQYVTSFNSHFNGATGTEQQLDNMTRELNILYSKANPNKDEDYQIDHSGTVLVIDPQGNLVALFSPPIEAQSLADDYKTLLKNAKGS